MTLTHARSNFSRSLIHRVNTTTAPPVLGRDGFHCIVLLTLRKSPLADILPGEYSAVLLLLALQVRRGEELEHVERGCAVRDDDDQVRARVELGADPQLLAQ